MANPVKFDKLWAPYLKTISELGRYRYEVFRAFILLDITEEYQEPGEDTQVKIAVNKYADERYPLT